MPDPGVSPPNFNRVARLYRWAEYLLLGNLLQKTRLEHLPSLPHTGHALILGDGDGRFTAALLRSRPHLQATAVDGSPGMLRLLSRRCRFANGRLTLQHADLRHLSPLLLTLPASELIATHFTLDCLSSSDLAVLAHTLGQHAAPSATWLVSDFALPPHQPWRALGAVYIRLLYFAFRMLTGLQTQHLPPIHDVLSASGWQLRTRRTRLAGLLFSDLWAAAATPQLHRIPAPDATAPHRGTSTQT